MQSLLAELDSVLEPAHIAVQDTKGSYSWHEVRMRVLSLASRMLALKMRRIALHADNSLEWLLIDMACQTAGVLCVPLPLFFSRQQLAHVLKSCAIDAVFTQLPELFESTDESALCMLPGIVVLSVSATGMPRIPPGTAKITFTSGSTGTPKGVCLGTEQQIRQARELMLATDLKRPVHLCVLPLSTLLENIAGVYAPLLAGGKVILRTLQELGFVGSGLKDPRSLLRVLQETRPDTLILIPQLLHLLVHACMNGWKAPPLCFIAVGGARVSESLIEHARSLGLPVYEGYGLSECASVVSLNTPRSDCPGSSGKVLPHVRVSIQKGEIHVAGNAMLGYLNEPDSWMQSSIATGDLGHLDAEGFLHIDGRSKNLLISSYGRNIAPEWVESELMASMLFRDVLVVGEAKPWCSALLGKISETIPLEFIEQAIAALNLRLPDYARMQRWILLPQPLAAYPDFFTANGRPKRSAITGHFSKEIEQLYATELQ